MTNLLILLGVVVIGAVGYYVWQQQSASRLQVSSLDVSVSANADTFVQNLALLQSLTFDDSVFSDPRFRSLVDFSQPVNPLPVGNTNPFGLH